MADRTAEQARSFAEALELPKTTKRWQPLSHQVPPPGDWLGWLMMAGRGAGKTEACAHHLVEHINGPPCMAGSIPHWMAIIAPTLGDAATACYSGPSGIRHFDQTAVMSSKVGGLLVTWPNGSQAKMYGARDPDDVERLRAGGNTCVVAGTLIRTARGQVPIEQVRVGEYVWTRRGLRRVLRSGMTRQYARIWQLETTSGRVLRATGDHALPTERGTVEMQYLAPGDTIWSWDEHSHTTASHGAYDPTGTSLVRVVPGTVKDCFIDTSGLSITDRYLRHDQDCMCITASTMTRTPPTSPVSGSAHRRSMHAHTQVFQSRVSLVATRHGLSDDSSQDDVSSAAQCFTHAECECVRHVATTAVVTSCCEDVAALHGSVRHAYVSFAAPHSTSRFAPAHVPVQIDRASQQSPRKRVVRLDRHSRNGCGVCARSVALGLSEPPSTHAVSLAPDHVRRIFVTDDEQPVYDLLVEHEHEIFANDIITFQCLAWCEELAAWRYLEDAFDQMRFGLRIGRHPRWIASTTPKPRPLIKKLYKHEIRGVALTQATMYENPHLPDHIKNALEEAYSGTSIGTQELYGRLVEQDTDALWTRETLERTRLTVAPPLRRIEVGVDPSGGAGEQGIVVDGVADVEGSDGRTLKHGYVLADASVHMKPEGWARTAVTAAMDWEADRIVVETNFGGDQAVALVVNACEQLGVSIPIRTVHASRGKRPRAEPVSALAVQDRWHLVGRFDELEDQLCTWTVDAGFSPDRIDAMVWPAWSMKLVSTLFHSVGTFGGSQMVHRTLGRRRQP